MSVQFLRAYDLVVGKAGSGLRVSDLRLTFKIKKTAGKTPNNATIKIYNLSPASENSVLNEFTDVVLNAGYRDALGLIFKGNITVASSEKQGVDTITELTCGDGDTDYREAVMNETIAAGTTDMQVIAQAVKGFTGGTSQGVVQLAQEVRARGRVLTGPTRKILDSIARNNGANWSIQDGRLHVLPVGALLPGQAILISSSTGMIGQPTVTDKGFEIKCLLNPQLQVHGAVKIDSKFMLQKSNKLRGSQQHARLPPNGICKIISIEHTGDTRGQEWYSKIEAVAA